MRLSRAGEYGVRCVYYLAGKPQGAVIPKNQVAQAMGIPEAFLAKIGHSLAKAGILDILQGAKGGYRLRKPPKEITLLEVVEAVVGELFLNDCILNPQSCSRSPHCAIHQVWQKARGALRATLTEANFEELLAKETCLGADGSSPQEEGELKSPFSGRRETPRS
jgi:Rrf2 family protein